MTSSKAMTTRTVRVRRIRYPYSAIANRAGRYWQTFCEVCFDGYGRRGRFTTHATHADAITAATRHVATRDHHVNAVGVATAEAMNRSADLFAAARSTR